LLHRLAFFLYKSSADDSGNFATCHMLQHHCCDEFDLCVFALGPQMVDRPSSSYNGKPPNDDVVKRSLCFIIICVVD